MSTPNSPHRTPAESAPATAHTPPPPSLREAVTSVTAAHENRYNAAIPHSAELDCALVDAFVPFVQELATLRTQLAVVTRERDEARNLLDHERTAKDTARQANTELDAGVRRLITNSPSEGTLTVAKRLNELLTAARKDAERLDWLEDTLCYAMVCLNGRSMESLPNTGHGWHNGQLRAAIDAARTQGGGE